MSNIANRRALLSASNNLATSMRPTKQMIVAACEALGAVLSDLSSEIVHIVPLSQEDLIALTDLQAAKRVAPQEPAS